MKLILAVIQDKDANRLSENLVSNNIPSTKLATTGGFLKSGNTTFMIGIDEEKIEEVIQIIKETCKTREEIVPYTMYPTGTFQPKIKVGGATVFIVDVDSFHHF